MIKDPMFNIYAKGGNVENRNKELKKDDLIKLAKDEQDICSILKMKSLEFY